MAIRWRADGRLVCAATTKPEEGDTYIDDRLHYQLSVVSRVLIVDVNHELNDLWHWLHGAPLLRAVEERKKVWQCPETRRAAGEPAP